MTDGDSQLLVARREEDETAFVTLVELATEAGFAHVRRIHMDNPFNSLYELTP